jgi:hypothetical protein
MVNILPQQYRQSVARAYSERLALTSAVVFVLTGIIAGFALLPSLSVMYAAEHGGSLQVPTDAQNVNQKSDAAAVAQAIFLANELQQSIATSSPTAALSAIVKDKPNGISISTMSYSMDAQNTRAIVITGKTTGRNDITVFQTTLTADAHFSSVSVPIDALVAGDNGSFTIKIVPNN